MVKYKFRICEEEFNDMPKCNTCKKRLDGDSWCVCGDMKRVYHFCSAECLAHHYGDCTYINKVKE